MKMFLKMVLLFICCGASAQYSLFDTTYVHEIKITSSDPNFWQTLDNDWQNADINGGDIPYHSTTVTIDGNELLEVGVRQKGFSSNFFSTTTKKPLKLHFSKFVEDREYDGVRKINLANGIGDPAIVKDKMAYNMFRFQGVASPRVAHAKLYINDTFWGIYAIIEQIDKRYLKRNFADNDGNLWKNKGNSDLSWVDSDPDSYTFELQTNETENDWTKFLAFIDFINNSTDAEFQNNLNDVLDIDEYFRILAIDILINNWDSHHDHGRNWYLYHEPKSNKIHWLPWDYNFAFDRGASGSGDMSLVQNNNKILNDRIYNIPAYKTRIFDYMCEILEHNFTAARLTPMLTNQQTLLIGNWGSSNDFFDLTDVSDFIDGGTWSGSPIGGPYVSMDVFIQARRDAINAQLANENHVCNALPTPVNSQDLVINEFMADNDDAGLWSDQDGDYDDWIELYNNTNQPIDLANYYLSDTRTFEHKWELPSVVIPAQGYLIVWADKDVDQTGLHTQFNLDKDGEEIILSHQDGTIIDSVTFEKQEELVSMSRIPNGTGEFVATLGGTFAAENEISQIDLIFRNSFEQQ